jgi:hypothetical protein
MKKLIVGSGLISMLALAGEPTPPPVGSTKTEAPKQEVPVGQLLRGTSGSSSGSGSLGTRGSGMLGTGLGTSGKPATTKPPAK